MSPTTLSAAEEQWRAQVAAMKAALAELKLPATMSAPVLDYDEDEDEDDDSYGYSSSGAGDGHDVWDFISDSEMEELGLDSGDLMDGTDGLDEFAAYGPEWLAIKCSEVSARKDGLNPSTFQDQIVGILASSQSEDVLSSQLTDLVGFDDLDFVIELISHRDDILAGIAPQNGGQGNGPAGPRLLTRSEREEALRQQDVRHKTAALGPTRSKEPVYPHVYKAYSAGNALSFAGKKYGLPPGSERKIFEKYEEYEIPAGKAGGLLPGHSLVKISDLDGLCRRTFVGYKSLNRMQSLVYPVAYKTSENMLICAPTGAVSIRVI